MIATFIKCFRLNYRLGVVNAVDRSLEEAAFDPHCRFAEVHHNASSLTEKTNWERAQAN
jgi:hypothetical protein